MRGSPCQRGFWEYISKFIFKIGKIFLIIFVLVMFHVKHFTIGIFFKNVMPRKKANAINRPMRVAY